MSLSAQGQSSHGTAIMWINDSQEVVIAADSKVSSSTSVIKTDGTIVPIARPTAYDACKIRPVGRTLVGVAGTVGVSGIKSVLDLDMSEIRRARGRDELVAGIEKWLNRTTELYRQAISDDLQSFEELSRKNRGSIFFQATFVSFDRNGLLLRYTSEASYSPGVGIRIHTNPVTGEGFGGIGEMKPLQEGPDGHVKAQINTMLLSAKTTQERMAALQRAIGDIASDSEGRESVGGHIDVVCITRDQITPLDVKRDCLRYFAGAY
jgi:hypothetical protein